MYDTVSLMQAMETIATSKVEEIYADALERQDPIWAVTAQETLAKRGNYEEVVQCLMRQGKLPANAAVTEAIIGSLSRMRTKSRKLYHFSKHASEEIKRGKNSEIDIKIIFAIVENEDKVKIYDFPDKKSSSHRYF